MAEAQALTKAPVSMEPGLPPRAPKPTTPQLKNKFLLQSLAGLINPSSTTEQSPLFLPVLPVEPSPTTGIQHMIPPLFHSSAARTAFANRAEVLNKLSDVATTTKSATSPTAAARQADDASKQAVMGKQSVANHDGWQWRKYGEKLVKGSPNPRSYYKCSHHGCTAKKIVERNPQGEILATEYKGDHSHPAPSSVKTSRFRPKPKPEPVPGQATTALSLTPHLLGLSSLPLGLTPFNGLLPIPDDLRRDLPGRGKGDDADMYNDDDEEEDEEDGYEQAPQVPLKPAPESESKASMETAAIIRKLREQQAQLPQDSPTKRLDALVAYAEEAERQFRASTAGGEEPEAKRQRTQEAATPTPEPDEVPSASEGSRAIEADTIEDGYKWRKYGQKQVKGNPYPRSYYKCTYPNCTVRKHVERSAEDASKVLITYEGQHQHAAPLTSRRTPSKRVDAAADEDVDMEDEDGEPIDLDSPKRVVARQAAPKAHTAAARGNAGMLPFALPVGLNPALALEAALNPFSLAQGLGGVNLEAITQLLKQHQSHTEGADASGNADGAAWDPLACLITPRTHVSPQGRPAGALQGVQQKAVEGSQQQQQQQQQAGETAAARAGAGKA